VLVAGVGAFRAKYPEVVDPILESIEGISQRFLSLGERLAHGEIANEDALREEP